MNIRRLFHRPLRVRVAGPADQTTAFLSALAALIARNPDFGARPGGRHIRIDLHIRTDEGKDR